MKTETQELKIRGMICRSCVGDVEALLLHTRGVIRAKVSYFKGQAQLEYDPELVSLDDVQKRLAENGYQSGDRGLSGLALDGLCLALTLLLTWLLLGGGHHSMELGDSAAYGAESMLAFALGTAPLLFLFGALGALIPKKWNKYFLKASAVLVTAMGLKMLIMGLRML